MIAYYATRNNTIITNNNTHNNMLNNMNCDNSKNNIHDDKTHMTAATTISWPSIEIIQKLEHLVTFNK